MQGLDISADMIQLFPLLLGTNGDIKSRGAL